MKKIFIILSLLIIANQICYCKLWEHANGLSGNILTLLKKDKQIFVVFEENGIYKTKDNGKTWKYCGLDLIKVLTAGIDSDRIYATTRNGELYISTDDGESWTEKKFDISYFRLLLLNSNLMIIPARSGVKYSTDAGETWKNPTIQCGNYVYCVSMKDSLIFAGTSGGICISKDKCDTWEQIIIDSYYINFISLAVIGDTIIAGTDQNGIYISTNLGQSWRQSDIGFPYTQINAIVTCGNNLFIATEIGIFTSSDMGQNWKKFNINNRYFISVAVLDNNIFTASDNKLFFSDDYGNSWYLFDNTFNGFITGIATSNNIVYASSSEGVYITSDRGFNWSFLTKDLKDIEYFSIKDIKTYDNKIILNTYNHGIYLSVDSCKSWKNICYGLSYSDEKNKIAINNNNIYVIDYYNGLFFSNYFDYNWKYLGFYNTRNLLSIAVRDSIIFVGKIDGITLSGDNGKKWIKIDNFPKCSVLTFTLKNDFILAGTDSNGVWISTDNGMNWISANNGLSDLFITSFAVNGDFIFAGTKSEGVFFTTNNGKVWSHKLKGLDSSFIKDLYSFGDFVFANADDSIYYMSLNNLDTWNKLELPNNKGNRLFINSFNNLNNNLIIGTDEGLWSTSNLGKNWFRYDTLSYFIYKSFGSRITVENNNIIVFDDKNVCYHSSDNGKNWKTINTGLEDFTLRGIKLRNNILYAGSSRGFLKSYDFGRSWGDFSSGLTQKEIKDVAYDEKNILVCTDSNKLFYSTDNADSWSLIKDLTSDTSVTAITISNNYLCYGTYYDENVLFISSDYGQTWENPFKKNNIGSLYFYKSTFKGNILGIAGRDGISFTNDYGYTWYGAGGLYDSFYGDVCGSGISITDDYYAYATTLHKGGVFRLNLDFMTNVVPPQNFNDDNLIIYPNPASDFINIKTNSELTNKKITIFGLLANPLWQGILKDESIRIDISSFPVGVYFVKVGIYVKMFIKN